MHVDCEVVLELPLMEKVAPPDADFPRNTGLTKPITVLVVEDDEEAAFMAQIWLTQAGDGQFRMEWSASLRQAMARLGRPGIDVVLLDLGMPELNGYRSCRALTTFMKDNLPVVIFTSDDRDETRDLTLGYGVTEYLLKYKTSPAQLRQALRNAVLG